MTNSDIATEAWSEDLSGSVSSGDEDTWVAVTWCGGKGFIELKDPGSHLGGEMTLESKEGSNCTGHELYGDVLWGSESSKSQ